MNDVKDRNIAMVFQNYALYPHMTVYKNMAFSQAALPRTKLPAGSKLRRTFSALATCWTASPSNFPVVSGSVSPWVGPLCGSRKSSSLMSR